jgi:hypothetical protein
VLKNVKFSLNHRNTYVLSLRSTQTSFTVPDVYTFDEKPSPDHPVRIQSCDKLGLNAILGICNHFK